MVNVLLESFGVSTLLLLFGALVKMTFYLLLESNISFNFSQLMVPGLIPKWLHHQN